MNNTEDVMSEREKNADTLSWMLGFDSITKMKLEASIKESGVKSFLLNFRKLDFSLDEKEKIAILKRILVKLDGDIDTINFGDVDCL